MEIKRTTEIVVEKKRRFVVRQQEHPEQVFCSSCSESMLTAEQAAAVFAVSRRAVYQMVENGTVHFTETGAGVLFICPGSLADICNIKIHEDGL